MDFEIAREKRELREIMNRNGSYEDAVKDLLWFACSKLIDIKEIVKKIKKD